MDYRDEAACKGQWYESFDERNMTCRVLSYEDSDGADCEMDIPVEFQVCPTCDGRGRYVNPSIDAHGISADEWANEWDDDSREDYMRGRYDIPCATCHELRVSPWPINPDHIKAVERILFERSSSIAEYEAERRMGA